MKTRVVLLSFILVFCLVLFGCGATAFKEIKPIYPKVGHPDYPKTVDSLQPKLEWKPTADSDVSYDLIIYNCIEDNSWGRQGPRFTAKDVVYYREAVTETECKIEKTLEPDTVYIWSVRVRRGTEVSDWSAYDYTMATPDMRMTWKNHPFYFKTPKSQD
jgi:hypothetical protein